MDWPTDDLETSNLKLAPSKLKGGFVTKRKQPDGGFDIRQYINSKKNEDEEEDDEVEEEEEVIQHQSKRSKSREESAAKRPNRYKMLNQATKAVVIERKSIDPRFMDYAGKYDKKQTEQNMAFLDDLRRDEIAVLKKEQKKTKDSEKKSDLRRAIQSREEYLRGKDKSHKKDELLSQYKQEQKSQAKLGVVPRQINDKQLKKQLGMAQDFLSLSSNQVDKRIKHRMERQTNRDKANFRKNLSGDKK